MATNERLLIARSGMQVKPPGFRLLLNASSCALPEALKLARLAWTLRYEAVLISPPWYYRNASASGLAAFMRAVLDASKLPVILYHIPQLTGVPFDDALLDAIGPHANLAGIKDSTGDEAELRRLSARFREGSYMVGNDRLVAACFAAGGKGSITACASVVPDLVKAVRADPSQQGKLNSVRALLEKFGLAAAVKAVLARRGFGVYASRAPMEGLLAEKAEQLIGMLESLGVLQGPHR
jgi:dihydrodipicolinate synthase/N-acetylneuraminate lyase